MGSEILKYCLERGFLLDKEILTLLNQIDIEIARQIVERINVICKERLITKSCISKNQSAIQYAFSSEGDKKIVEKLLVNLGLQIEITKETISERQESRQDFKILQNFTERSRKIEVVDFVKHFRNRFEDMKNLLKERQELTNLISINKISEDRPGISLIGMVYSKRVTKNKNIILEIEDSTGKISVLINHNRQEVYEKAKNVLIDDVIGLKCGGSREIVFANDIIFPDVFVQEKKRSSEDEQAIFISDVHVGSINFLEKNFLKFIDWINNEGEKVRYIFMVGDNIDGVGVHPTQESFLNIKDIRDQYRKLAEYLSKIRKNIKIFICPGQHDATRLAEPQPAIEKEYSADLYALENVFPVSNPAMIEVAGLKVLMYHGDSIHDYINEIEYLRTNRGQDTPAKAVKEMLKRRHLASMHSYAVYVPDEEHDSLMIRDIPDIITTGEMHRGDIDSYNNILIICNSCWQKTTPYEEKMGNHPIPCKAHLLNLKTREVKILDFLEEEQQEKKPELAIEVKT
jgi:DNA polymerase II small subunit